LVHKTLDGAFTHLSRVVFIDRTDWSMDRGEGKNRQPYTVTVVAVSVALDCAIRRPLRVPGLRIRLEDRIAIDTQTFWYCTIALDCSAVPCSGICRSPCAILHYRIGYDCSRRSDSNWMFTSLSTPTCSRRRFEQAKCRLLHNQCVC